jgi:galactose oxidase-like protein
VLIAGGEDANFNLLASAELYNPATGTFTPTGSMITPRVGQSATLPNNGQALMAGAGATPCC